MRSAASIVFALFSLSALGAEVEVPFTQGTHGVPIVEVKVNGRAVKFILDTGSAQTLISADITTGTAPGPSRFRADHNGFEAHGTWWLIDFEVGNRRWHERVMGIIDISRVREFYGKDIAGLLGQDVLEEFASVRIDYRRKVITLETQ